MFYIVIAPLNTAMKLNFEIIKRGLAFGNNLLTGCSMGADASEDSAHTRRSREGFLLNGTNRRREDDFKGEMLRLAREEHELRMQILRLKERFWQMKTGALLRENQGRANSN